MFVRLGDEGPPTLEEPEDCSRFHVESSGNDPGALGERLDGAGRIEGAPPGPVWIDVDWVRSQARGRVPEGWDRSFEGMLGYASSKGWLDDEGRSIRAHVAPASG